MVCRSPSAFIKNEVTLDNIPNPFTENTLISFSIGKEFTQAELRITDVLGRLVKTYPITNMKGTFEFDGNKQMQGIYYSSLIIDGAVVKSKTIIFTK